MFKNNKNLYQISFSVYNKYHPITLYYKDVSTAAFFKGVSNGWEAGFKIPSVLRSVAPGI